jgi:DNA-binding MarR family transcriptional regulator
MGATESVPAVAYQWRDVYQLFSATFIELDTGDARFLESLAQQIFGGASGVTLTIPHFWALVHLEPIDGRTMTELAHLLIRDKGTVTTIVDKLEAYGWVTRIRGKEGDRRYWRVVLTPEGRALRERVVPAHDAWVSVRFADLTAVQLRQLASLLQTLRLGLRADPERAAQAAIHAKRPPAEASG